MAAQNKLDVCNLALTYLGEGFIDDLNATTVSAQTCEFIYEYVRQSLLREFVFSFSCHPIILNKSLSTPAHTFSNAYTIPANVMSVCAIENKNKLWSISKREVLINLDQDNLNVWAVLDQEDESLMDSTFVELFAVSLARLLCPRIAASSTKLNDLEKIYISKKNAALKANARELKITIPDYSQWVNVIDGFLSPLASQDNPFNGFS